MESRTFYNEVLTEHNVRPAHKRALAGECFSLEGVNPSCGDDITLSLRVEDGVIVDGAFEGDGSKRPARCATSPTCRRASSAPCWGGTPWTRS